MTSLYLALALSIAVVGAFTDISSGRVRNKHLIIAFISWIILAICEYLIFNSSSIPVLPLALNVILAVVMSIIFYLTDIWAPGDCKLYIVISLIFPMYSYVVRNGNIFPALNFIIYAFALGYIFLIITTITKKTDIHLNFSLKYFVSILINAGIISFLNLMLNTFVPKFFFANQMLCILSLSALICLIPQKANIARSIIGFISLVYITIQSISSGSWLNTCLNLTISLIIASAIEFISNKARVNTYREISGNEVKPGMILSLMSLLAMLKYSDPKLPKTTTENRRSRITKSQADAVKNWCKKSHNKVIIVEMMPFAPFIAGAVVIQILRYLLLS